MINEYINQLKNINPFTLFVIILPLIRYIIDFLKGHRKAAIINIIAHLSMSFLFVTFIMPLTKDTNIIIVNIIFAISSSLMMIGKKIIAKTLNLITASILIHIAIIIAFMYLKQKGI